MFGSNHTSFSHPKYKFYKCLNQILLKIYLNFSISDISGKEGITNDKLSKRSTLYALSLGQCMIK
jgi:hypothetical protein